MTALSARGKSAQSRFDRKNLLIEKLRKEGQLTEISPTGSREICTPAPTNTDEDYIAFTSDNEVTQQNLMDNGWIVEGKPDFYTGKDAGQFQSYRKGSLNLIVTPEYAFYRLFVSATHLAKRFNLLKKADRIALFQVVLYNVDPFHLEEDESDNSMKKAA